LRLKLGEATLVVSPVAMMPQAVPWAAMAAALRAVSA
jgi:hypothetical protein